MLYRGKDKKEFYLASLLYDSIEFRHIESVKSLLTEKGADPNIVLPKKGISPFHLVIGCDSSDFSFKVTSLILQYGGNPNVRSDDGLTPVHIAAAWGKTDILKLLLKNGGDPEVRDISRKTPFHYASEEGFPECLNILRSYLPTENELMRKEEDNKCCCLVLDKILVNNGAMVGEYNFVETKEPDSIILNSKPNHLQSLPQTDATEYILNWFTKQQNSTFSTTNSRSNIIDSVANTFGNNSNFECSTDSLAESDSCEKETKRYDAKYITFRKVYRKKRSKSNNGSKTSKCLSVKSSCDENPEKLKSGFDNTKYTDAYEEFSKFKEFSKESGVVSLCPSSSNILLSEDANSGKNCTSAKSISKQEKSSDYLTCSQYSVGSLDRNIFEITDDLSNLNLNPVPNNAAKPVTNKAEGDVSSNSEEQSFVSVSEVYKYEDKEEGVVLYERRLLKTPSECAKSVKSSNISSNLSSLPPTLDYDTDTLRKELTVLGFNPGPITITTKRVYLRKLHQLKKYPVATQSPKGETKKRVYSLELEKTVRSLDWCNNIGAFKALEEVLVKQFSSPDRSRKWREGVNKCSFTYLLLDPRITQNLPYRIDSLQPLEAWKTFLSAIFYVGKGKRSRPYQHLYDAVDLWKKEQFSAGSKKLQKILDIWKNDCGVICLHVFLNIIPVEAYTREAAMISALKLDNLTNAKSGEFYGIPATWSQKQKRMLGVYLLHKAMMIFLQEGERQLCPADID